MATCRRCSRKLTFATSFSRWARMSWEALRKLSRRSCGPTRRSGRVSSNRRTYALNESSVISRDRSTSSHVIAQQDFFGKAPKLPAGFTYQPEFLTPGEEESLLETIETLPLAEAQYK